MFHDFKWVDVFPDERTHFRHGQKLAEGVQRRCPEGLVPALLLTRRTDIEQGLVTTPTYFLYVLNIDEWLSAEDDFGLAYLATHLAVEPENLGRFANLSLIGDPAAVAQFLAQELSVDLVAEWLCRAWAQGWREQRRVPPSWAFLSGLSCAHAWRSTGTPLTEVDPLLRVLHGPADLDRAHAVGLTAEDLARWACVSSDVGVVRAWVDAGRSPSEALLADLDCGAQELAAYAAEGVDAAHAVQALAVGLSPELAGRALRRGRGLSTAAAARDHGFEVDDEVPPGFGATARAWSKLQQTARYLVDDGLPHHVVVGALTEQAPRDVVDRLLGNLPPTVVW